MTLPSAPMYCANHPTVETTLRCNRCEKPICPRCAIATPTGYRCKECVKGQQKTFDNAQVQDFILGGLAAVILALIGSFIVPRLGFFTIILSPVAGVIIAEVVRAITQKRRSKRLYQIILGGIILGCLPLLLSDLVTAILFLSHGNLNALWSVLLQGIYTFLVASTAYYRLSGIQINV